ncbi:hypothetical protein T265_08626 [Opisthorchis viverrini]|uniref:Peptidase A1 domain-containing protein n=1 Tax=Opisthorchis viverrini TaxID=6198 RepID=A0A075A7Q1_OPIVI|nr:hypothetical protein T265_08626 [Opisthorchis viverrini]KER23504.1 hypothetical protein T265_08626 [Opisthorchis viverrini]
MYVSTAVHLGSYKQVFQVLLDTNSDISWVPSTETTERTLQRKTQYKKGTSKEYSAHPQPLLIDDDFQSVSGDIAFDRFQVSELIDRPLTKPFQIAGVCMNEFKFGIVTKTKVDPKLPNGVDGVLGLSRKVTYHQFGRTLLESMYEELGIKEEIFALTLCPNDNPELATGHMTFGGLCRDCHKTEFSDFRATTPERWCITFERAAELRRLQVFDNRCHGTIGRVGWCWRTRNEAIRKRILSCATGTSIEECIQHQNLRWLGRAAHAEPSLTDKSAVFRAQLRVAEAKRQPTLDLEEKYEGDYEMFGCCRCYSLSRMGTT